jgi:hypothetical protein
MSTQLKISASTLEDYRTCKFGKYGKNLTDFITKLDQPWTKTEAQSKGDAYHKLLEHGGGLYFETTPELMTQYRVHEPDMNIDWIFSEKQAAPALATFTEHPFKKHEVWGRLNFDIGGYNIRMNLRKDAVTEGEIWDYKTTSSKYAPGAANYYESLQWPLYMMESPDVSQFHYRVFHFLGDDVNQYDFIFQKEVQKEKAAIMWLTDLIGFAEQNNIIHKFYTPQQA